MKNKQFLVIGLSRFGSELAAELYRQGAEVLAVDRDMDAVEAMRGRLTDVMQADAQDEDVRFGIRCCDRFDRQRCTVQQRDYDAAEGNGREIRDCQGK